MSVAHPVALRKHVKVTRYGEYIVVDIKANAFVHHMVRNIVGSLMEDRLRQSG